MDSKSNNYENILAKLESVLDGNLEVTFSENSNGDSGRLEKSLDKLLANYQEILLFTATLILSLRKEIKKMVDASKSEYDISAINLKVAQLEEMIREFNFYHVSFTDDKIVSKKESETNEIVND